VAMQHGSLWKTCVTCLGYDLGASLLQLAVMRCNNRMHFVTCIILLSEAIEIAGYHQVCWS
jgi:hypothetical protein